MSEISTGANETGLAEQSVEETGVNELESAETVSPEEVEVEEPVEETQVQDDETNSAFARMRRESEQAREEANELRRGLAELKASIEARDNTFARLTGNAKGDISAIAEATGMSEDEVVAEMESAQEMAQKDLQIEQLEEKITNLEVDTAMQRDLQAIQKIDPTIKSLSDLGAGYAEYVIAGLPPEKAYWAIKAERDAKQSTPPKAVGKVATGTAEKEYYTDAEIDAMTPDQLSKNYNKILASWERNK